MDLFDSPLTIRVTKPRLPLTVLPVMALINKHFEAMWDGATKQKDSDCQWSDVLTTPQKGTKALPLRPPKLKYYAIDVEKQPTTESVWPFNNRLLTTLNLC